MKKAALYTPYSDTLGGGERYLLSLAQVLLDHDWQVEATLGNKTILDQSRERFGLPLKGLKLIDRDYLEASGYQRLINHRHFDLLFWVSDGSVPTMLAKKNWLHFQVPFHDRNNNRLFNIMKFALVDKVICNSLFTKKVIDKEYGISSEVWYPPVAIENFSPSKKVNSIIAVGRFETTMNVKRQDILVEAFRQLFDSGLRNWRLILAGGSAVAEENNQFLKNLKSAAAGYPIEFWVNVPFSRLQEGYSSAKIFWHAAGFGFDEINQPEKMEHFGMTTVEALASGCWPLVYAAGGQREIFRHFSQAEKCLWRSKEELVEKTKQIISQGIGYQPLLKLADKFSRYNFNEIVKKAL